MSEYDELLEMEPPEERFYASNPASGCGCESCQLQEQHEPGTELARAENPIHLLTNPPAPVKVMKPMEAAAWAGGLGAASAGIDIAAQTMLPNKQWVPYVSIAAKLGAAFMADRAGHRTVSTSLVSAGAYQAAWLVAAKLMAPPQPEAPPVPNEVAPAAATPPADPTVEGYYRHPDEEVTYQPNGDSYRRMPHHETGYWHTQTDAYGRPVELYHPGY